MQWPKAGREPKAGVAEPELARSAGEALAERDGPASRHGHCCSLDERALVGPGQGGKGAGSRVPMLWQQGRCMIYC